VNNRQDKKPVTDDPSFGVSPKEILHAILRRKWLILASTFAVGIAVGAGTLRQPKIYQGVAQLMIDPVLPRYIESSDQFDNFAELARAERAFNNTQYEILKGRIVLRKAAATIGLDKDEKYLAAYNISKDREDVIEGIVAVLSRQLTVEPRLGSRIVKVVIEDFDADRAARIANGVAQAYQDHTLGSRIDNTRGASEWLDKRVAEYGQKLADIDKQLMEFRRENMLLALTVEDRQSTYGAKLQTLNQKLVENRTALIALKAKRTMLQNELEERNGDFEAMATIVSNQVVQNLRSDMARIQGQRAELSARYGPLHHTMIAANKQVEEINAMIVAEVKQIIEALNAEISAAEMTEKGIMADINVEKHDALALNDLLLKQSTMSRDYGLTKTTYETLLKKQTEADLSGSTNVNFVHWFERAEPVHAAVRPSVARSAAVGLMLGLLLGLLVAVGGVLLDTTVHTQADVEEGLGLTFLGILPSIQEEGEKQPRAQIAANGERPASRDLFIMQNPKSSLAECARSIRTNILFMGTDKPLRRILVTSPGPSEGKSTIAVNLSVVMAQAGNRVLLVDTDLRRPRLHYTFGVSGEKGLTSVLLGAAQVTDVIKSTEVIGLDVLTCGPLPPNPAELLHSEGFQKLLKDLEGRYDRVVLDSPPIGVVTDAAILSQTVDGTLLVAKASKTTKDAVRRARRLLSSVNANIIGLVLNDIDLQQGGYGYSYYYYRRYGYGTDVEKGAEV
jgi:polysaccharide biosynthesis transport protein